MIAVEYMENRDKQDILEAISLLADQTQEYAENGDRRFDRIDGDMSAIKDQMVTKSYLDDKLADLPAGSQA